MMFLLYPPNRRRVYRGVSAHTSAYGHHFGGADAYAGLTAYAGQPPVHLLFRLDLNDARLGLTLPGARWLPLLCAIRYGACDLAYRALSDTRVEIVMQAAQEAWHDYPRHSYPDALPARPLDLTAQDWDPDRPETVLPHIGVLGCEELTPSQFEALARYVDSEGLYDPEIHTDWENVEEFVREAAAYPFLQGKPEGRCPDPACGRYGQYRGMHTFVVFEADSEQAKSLWGDAENLLLSYRICPECSTILACNECS